MLLISSLVVLLFQLVNSGGDGVVLVSANFGKGTCRQRIRTQEGESQEVVLFDE